MIIKVVTRRTQEKSHFERLGRYILDAKSNDALMFQRTAEYVTDAKGGGEKVAWCRVSNCYSDTPAVAIAEVLATQARNTRTTADKTYHLVVSLPHQERLTQEQAADIEDAICAGLGFADHQRISAVHCDTNHFHIHIAVNKIHPTTFRCIDPYYPYYKLDALAKELEIKHGLHQDNRIGQDKRFSNVGQMETHQKEDSFLRWLHENAGKEINDGLDNAQSWHDIHQLLVAYGAIIKPRGAGLAIMTFDGKAAIKASSLDRRLSFKALTDRFGEYQPPASQSKPKKQYRADARKRAEATLLYADYQRSRQSSCEGRSAAIANLRTEYADNRSDIKQRYRQRRASVKANTKMDDRTKRSAYQELSKEMAKELRQLSQSQRMQRQMIQRQYPSVTWDEHLTNVAAQGNVEALAILRKRKESRERISEALLTVKNLDEACDIIMAHFKPTVLKNGRVVYRAKDGGVVCDEAKAITVQQPTDAATLLALSLANERFQGKALIVEGSDEFKNQIARHAVLEGLSVRFADPVIESNRHRYASTKELTALVLKTDTQECSNKQQRQSRQPYLGR